MSLEGLIFQPLNEKHERRSFRCGESTVDGFLRNEALRDRYIANRVAVFESQPLQIVAFYALAPAPTFFETERAIRAPQPTLWLDWLATHQDWQGRGIGEEMLNRVIDEALLIAARQEAARQTPIGDIGARAISPRSEQWLTDRGFQPLGRPGPMRKLSLPLAVIRQIRLPNETPGEG